MMGFTNATWQAEPSQRLDRSRSETAVSQPNLSLAEPETAVSNLEAMRARLLRLDGWLLKHAPSHPQWQRAVWQRVNLLAEIERAEDSAFHYLREPGDDYRGVVIFSPDTDVPQIAGKWQRLPDGRIEARVSLFELRIMAEMSRITRGE